MTVKAIRHHSVLPGRGEDDAHTQYLRLTETAQQTMNGDLRCWCFGCLVVGRVGQMHYGKKRWGSVFMVEYSGLKKLVFGLQNTLLKFARIDS
jgi:hypothetical protein